jgi:uncharacterized protein YcbX
MHQVGVVRAVARYPVKSMAGEYLEAAELTLQGIAGDRRYAFVQAASRSLFPWLTGREHPDLLRYRPTWDGASGRPRLLVATPSGAVLPIDADALRLELERASARPLYLMRDHRGNYDVAPLSLIADATVARLCAACGLPPQPDRFRANLYVATADGTPFGEDAWVGRILRIGDTARVAVNEPDDRCVMITLDPTTGAARPALLRAVAELHGNKAGVYAVVLAPGPVRAGDPVVVEG